MRVTGDTAAPESTALQHEEGPPLQGLEPVPSNSPGATLKCQLCLLWCSRHKTARLFHFKTVILGIS